MRILITDDEPLLREHIAKIVRELKPDDEVVEFADTDSLIRDAKRNGVDVAFLDICMPETSGIELAGILTKVNPQVNIIFVTGFDNYREEAMDMFASGYVKKPATREKIANQLAHLRYQIAPRKKVTVSVKDGFSVKSDGKEIAFERKKTAELLAYLIYRKGKSVDGTELTKVLFSGDAQSQGTNYITHCKKDLIESLATVGLDGLLVFKTTRDYAVDMTNIDSDVAPDELASAIGECFGWRRK